MSHSLSLYPDLLTNPLQFLLNPLVQPIFVPILYLVFDNLALIINTWYSADRVQDENRRESSQPETFDFIVGTVHFMFAVGAGSAGCIVANRLSKEHKVLLLEAGGDPHPLQFIPGVGQFLYAFPEVDWMHRTVPQRFASLNSVNNQSSWNTGLGLGGSGNINLMIHLRGHKRDFDNWSNITQDSRWSYEGVLHDFKVQEEYEIPGDERYHGYNGEMRIERADYVGLGPDFVKAAQEIGYENVDLNGAPFTEGFDIIRFPIRRGIRQAPYKAFLVPALTRDTLTVRRYAHVNRILFRDGNVAYGVQYDRHGRKLTAYATKEVIISAGAVGTPKLLKLSGIGPSAELGEFGIPVVSDLSEVGENLQDHLGVFLSYFYIDQPRSVLLERDITPKVVANWLFKGTDVLTSPGCQATGVFASSLAKARGEADWPDLQLFFFAYAAFQNSAKHLSRLFNLKEDEITEYYRDAVGKDGVHVIVSGARPLARGYVRLGGSSPYDKPVINPNYLGDPDGVDHRALKEGVYKALEIMENTDTFGVKLGARFNNKSLPGCEHLEFRTDSYWDCFISRFTVTLHHPGGTAAMGTVVDNELKVFGVENLRVMDTSVEAQITVTNTQASTMMIAEKGSSMVLDRWKEKDQIKN